MQGPCPLTYTPRGAGLTSQVSFFFFFLLSAMPFPSCFFASPILLLDIIIFVECCLYINLSTAMGGNLLLSNPWKPKKSNVIKPSETSTPAALRYTISLFNNCHYVPSYDALIAYTWQRLANCTHRNSYLCIELCMLYPKSMILKRSKKKYLLIEHTAADWYAAKCTESLSPLLLTRPVKGILGGTNKTFYWRLYIRLERMLLDKTFW